MKKMVMVLSGYIAALSKNRSFWLSLAVIVLFLCSFGSLFYYVTGELGSYSSKGMKIWDWYGKMATEIQYIVQNLVILCVLPFAYKYHKIAFIVITALSIVNIFILISGHFVLTWPIIIGILSFTSLVIYAIYRASKSDFTTRDRDKEGGSKFVLPGEKTHS